MKSKFLKVLKHDLTIGISANISKYIIAIIYLSILCIKFFSNISAQNVMTDGNTIDCIIYIFKGIKVYIPENGEPFAIPFDWLIIQSLISLLVIQYPTQDLYTYGMQILIRTRNRCSWWLSKCIWNIASVFIFYMLSFVLALVFSAMFGNVSMTPNNQVNNLINLINLENIQINLYFYITVLILPFLTSVAVSLLQMALSFLINPIISFLVIMSLMAASAFCHSIFLFGNYSMLLRNEVFYINGFDNRLIIIVNIILIAVSIFVGLIYFVKIDILKKD